MSIIGNVANKSATTNRDDRFPDPFMDMASLAMPNTIQDALRWCEFIMSVNGPYRSAISRVISYFITEVEITTSGGGDGEDRIGREEKQKYLDFLNDTLGINSVLRNVALDYMVYGNSFTSLLMPFRRYLSCPQSGCGFEMPLRKICNTAGMSFQWTDYSFHAKCPKCGYRGKWRHIDRRSGETGQIKVKRWSPHDMDILWDPYTDDTAFIWKIPETDRELIRRGHPFHLERANWEIIQAVKNNQHLLFDPEVIYHMKEEPFSGIKNGWGISRVLTNFRQAWYVQILHRYNEAIALDHIVPFRVLTPEPRNGAGGDVSDPVLSMNMGAFSTRVQSMLRRHRQDPARWHVLPFPLQYQALGGDATQLAPHDLMQLGMDELLNAAEVPAELYRGSLTVQSAPAALRLFEANWSHLVHGLNRFLMRLVDNVSQVMSWEPVNCRLKPVTHADDLNRQMAKLQLMMGGQISRTTGLAAVGADFAEEERRKLEEERIVAEATEDMQRELEQASLMDEMAMPAPPPGDPAAAGGAPPAAGGGAQQIPTFQGMPGAMPGGGMPPVDPAAAGAAPGGMPPGGAAQMFAAGQPLLPNKPTTPEEMMQMASTLAQQAMGMPESQKKSFLIQLKKEDPTIHALVTSQIEEMRRDAQLRGGEMVMQQEYGAQPPTQ